MKTKFFNLCLAVLTAFSFTSTLAQPCPQNISGTGQAGPGKQSQLGALTEEAIINAGIDAMNSCTLGSFVFITGHRTSTEHQGNKIIVHAIAYGNCALPLTAACSCTPVSAPGATDGTATATVTGGTPPYKYHWSIGGDGPDHITNLPVGQICCDITDVCGRTTFCCCNVTLPIQASCNCTPVSEPGGSDGTASVAATGGTGGYTYSWDNGGTGSTITNLTAGTYTVIVTDANGGTGTCSCDVTEPQNCEILVSIMNPAVSQGSQLNFSVMIHHLRPKTVTTPLFIAIYDQSGNIVYTFANEEYTFEYGDMIHVKKTFTVPNNFSPGTYYIKAGVGEMKQGAIKHAESFQVVQ